MNAMPFPHPARAWRVSSFDTVLSMGRVIVATLFVAPIPVLIFCWCASRLPSGWDFPLLLFFFAWSVPVVIIWNRMSVPGRVIAATILAIPWALISFSLFSTLLPFHGAGMFSLRLFWALLLGAETLYGFRLVVRTGGRPAHPGWPPSPPKPPPSGGAGVLAPLKPRPPVLIASEAKELPHASDETAN